MTRALPLVFLTPLLALGAAATANAGGFSEQSAEAPVVVAQPAYDWTGAYAGLQLGALQATSDVGVESATGLTVMGWSLEPEGGEAGAYVGYNRQSAANVVYGVEAEMNWADASDFSANISSGSSSNDAEINVTETAAIRARIGYAMDRTLIYATAGWAWAAYDGSVTRTIGGVPGHHLANWSDSANGWTVGAGVEHAFSERWVGRIDYRYSDFGDLTFGPVGVAGSEVIGDLVTHEVRFGLTMRF